MDGAISRAEQPMEVDNSGAPRHHRPLSRCFASAGGGPVRARHRQLRLQRRSGAGQSPNDAEDVAATLKSLGYKVTLKLDLDLAAMQPAIDEFALESADADVPLFYHAGPGQQPAGQNYLPPAA